MKITFTLLTLMLSLGVSAQNNDPGSQKSTNYYTIQQIDNQKEFIQNVCDTTFFDGFEGGNTNLWTIVGGGKNAITTNPYAGTYCMELNNQPSGHDNGVVRTFSNITPSSMSFSVRSSSTTTADGYFVPKDQSGGLFFWSYMNSNGTITFSGGYTTPYVADTWYNIDFRNINWTAKTTDLYINNVFHTVINFSASANSLGALDLYSFHTGANSYYDNILFGSGQPPVPTFNISNTFCYEDSTGAIDNTVSGGTPPFTYNWSNGATTEDISGVTAGVYTLTVTDSLGCANVLTDSILSTNPQIIVTVDSTMDSLTCFGDTTGSIYISVSGGSPGYSYLWSVKDTAQDVTNIWGGTHVVTITDSVGCTTTQSFTITQPDSIQGNEVITDESITGNDGAIDLTASGGTPGYTYNWSTGDTTEDLTGLSGGTYTVTITDSIGCTNVITCIVNSAVGINKVGKQTNIAIYPNPASGSFVVKAPHKGQFTITDAQGRLVTTGNYNEQTNLSQQAKGMYFVNLHNGETLKLVLTE